MGSDAPPVGGRAVQRRIEVKSRRRDELIDLTARINREIQSSGLQAGLCHVSVLHTTASLVINENEPGLLGDLLKTMDRLVPVDPAYAHPDGNGHAHIKATLLGSAQTLSINAGRLQLGTWQSVLLVEFDGPRERTIAVSLIPV
ncbi:MAG TPA: secondary thiamine-phosphate synthase enzyme YjbQ [Nitrospiria bacterium]|nr:secondary thiamine-phosphate synthase enzyme YjbQ [Nitrospiria bacterium]